jgi:thiamine pyrophosphate-dependent acetolactate synthase large subunit-like protein
MRFVAVTSSKDPINVADADGKMVALSMADGYARVTNKPQCVIIHTDVGTQNLGAAVHNASCGRAPVLIFAGLSPYTTHGEYRGSRTEYIHWIQDVPDQKAIVAQYCRYTGEIKRGANIKQMVNRALTFATSEPKGPVYLYGAREAVEEDIKPYSLNQSYWTPVEPAALTPDQASQIATLLVKADRPLVITGYSGRVHGTVDALRGLADVIPGLRVLDTGGSDMNFPADHPAWQGFRLGSHSSIQDADVILVVDCDVPWIPTQCAPHENATILHIDSDPLKNQMPVFWIDAIARHRAHSGIALRQVADSVSSMPELRDLVQSSQYSERFSALQQAHQQRLKNIAGGICVESDGSYNTAFLASAARRACPKDTIWAIEAVTNAMTIAEQIQATMPGSWINCGGGGLGWSGGGALGIKLATDHTTDGKGKFVCQIVGDGTYMFSIPSTVAWISQRYEIPVLTIVLNNKGWNAPRQSMLLVHPDGYGSRITNEELNISFETTPDYGGIAKAGSGGKYYTGIANTAEELETVLSEAVEAVHNGVSAVIDARIGGPAGKYSPPTSDAM